MQGSFFLRFLGILIVAAAIGFGTSGCEKEFIKKPKSDPMAIFEQCWSEMDQQYALFIVKDVDWAKIHDSFREKITDTMTEKSLFIRLGDMLESLKDGHVSISSDFGTDLYDNFYKTYPANFNFQNILVNYLNGQYQKIGPVIVKIWNGVGYLYYDSFEKDISATQADSVIDFFDQTKGLILDVRNNQGGNAINAERLASHFISTRKLSKYELNKNGPAHDDFSDPEIFYLSPGGKIYSKPVIVLTNRSCFSACNDFIMYMSGLSNIIIMGDQSGGGAGIPRNYLLANGWKLQYTATMTLSPAMQSVENGIPPDINIGISTADEVGGKDPIIEKAFNSLQ